MSKLGLPLLTLGALVATALAVPAPAHAQGRIRQPSYVGTRADLTPEDLT